MDIDSGPGAGSNRGSEIWITEVSPGGSGVLERFLEVFGEDPRRFYRLVEWALQPHDFELVDEQIRDVLRLIHEGRMPDEVNRVRTSYDEGISASQVAYAHFLDRLSSEGVTLGHAGRSAINSRVLRAGATTHHDELHWLAAQQWREKEEQLGWELEPRVFAHLLASDGEFVEGLHAAGVQEGLEFTSIVSMLWARGGQVRAQALQAWNPYADSLPVDRLLLSGLVLEQDTIEAAEPQWRELFEERLSSDGHASLSFADWVQAAGVVSQTLTRPISQGYLRVYPAVAGVTHRSDRLVVQFELDEVAQ